ncbi:MAG TPA: Xaa-Pro peptidase family protein [Verrucomicrobiae bacterium]|jgi:Xaa-Pro aminopeptidase
MSDSEDLLIVADSERDANMLFAVGLFVPDPFIYFRIDGQCHVVVSDLEINRVRKHARHCRVISYNQCLEKLRRKVKRPGLATVISYVLRERHLRKIFVPPNFPYGLARELRNYRIKVRVKTEGFFPERAIKRADEIKKISAALTMAEVGLAEGMQVLKSSKIARDGTLVYHGGPLTSEKVRGVIDTAILQSGGWTNRTIVAGGRQACDPHEQGHGMLRANEPIVLDVFPRSQRTGYFGDLTRTVVRGRASEAVRRLYDTVLRAQEMAFGKLVANTKAADVHDSVQAFFETEGYKTCRKAGQMHGFFHGSGHGVGLELHEAPSLGTGSRDVLAAGHVVTIEPGLYYPGVGAVRLEDVAAVTANGARNLTKCEKALEL